MPKLIRYGALACALGMLASFLGMWLTGDSGAGTWLVALAGLLLFFSGAVTLLIAVFRSALQKLRESQASLL